GEVAFDRYAYCSLFGMNSLQDVREAVVERTIRLSKEEKLELRPTAESIGDLVKHGEELARKGAWAVGSVASLFGFSGVGSAASRVLFLTVSSQIVCFDDLERRGKDFDLNDVLGLASHLKEECKCKVVLILNDERLEQDKVVFERYLEKVVDISTVF